MIYHRRAKLCSLECLWICDGSRSSCLLLPTLLLDSGNFVNVLHQSNTLSAILQLSLQQVGKGDIRILPRQQQALSKHRGVNSNTRLFPNPAGRLIQLSLDKLNL